MNTPGQVLVWDATKRDDGKRIVSGSDVGTLKVWLLDRWLEKTGKPDGAEAAKVGPE